MGNSLKDQHYKNMGIKPQMLMYPFEAESVAFIVCNHFGIDTSDYSFAYLASWSSSKELPELRASLKTIQTTAHDLIDRMDEQIQRHMEIQRQPETIGTDIQNTQEIHHSRR